MKRAFTLMELLVYIAIMGFIIVVAGRVFSDSTSMRIRSQNLLKSSSEIGKLANLIREDVSQMGVKAWGNLDGDDEDKVYKVVVHDSVYMDAVNKKDSSSYKLIGKARTENNFADTLIFRKAVFNADGKFMAVREITWRLSNDSLFRKCKEVSSNCPQGVNAAAFCAGKDNDCDSNTDVLIAINVTNFKLTPSMPIKQDTLFPSSSSNGFKLFERPSGDVSCTNNDTYTDVFNFRTNSNPGDNYKSELYLAENLTSKTTWNDCAKLTFKKNSTYVIEFGMPYKDGDITQFVPGKDHLAIGLRKDDGNTITGVSDIFFYPPQDLSADETTRHFEFSTKKDSIENACVAITAAFYSPRAGNGTLSFKDFKVFQKVDESFTFPEGAPSKYGLEPDDATSEVEKIKEKRSVKAFELIVEMTIGKKEERKAGTFSQKDRGIIIATPNNGVIVEE